MLARRRSLIDFSPCNSTDRKYVKAVGCWTTTESEESESQLVDSNVKTNSAVLLGKNQDSIASCEEWSMGSFLERCPITPSPILSPVSSLACSPPQLFFFSQPSTELSTELSPANNNQSFCIISNASKKPALAEEDKKEEEIDNAKASHSLYTPKLQSYQLAARNTRKSFGADSAKEVEAFKQDHHHKPKATPKSNSIRTMRRYLRRELESASGESVIASGDDQASHCIVSPIINEDKKERGHRVGHSGLINGPHAPDRSIDGYEGSNCSGYGDSEVESSVTEHGRLSFARLHARPCHSFISDMKRNEMESKLIAWKEAKVLKLVNRLRKKEAEMNEWEYKQTSNAKRDMKEFERKMEKKRERAYEKMEKKIRSIEKKAEEKKAKETHTVSTKIANIYTAVDKIHSTGKLPWMLISLLLC